MRFDVLRRNRRTRIVQRLLHLRAEPCVVSLRIDREVERQRALVGHPREQNPHRVGHRQPHPVEHGCRAPLQFRIDSYLYQCASRHDHAPVRGRGDIVIHLHDLRTLMDVDRDT